MINFNLIRDRETGRPKGYGFCEYADQPIAESAIRNLNGFEVGGRPLRIDSSANSDRSAEEVTYLYNIVSSLNRYKIYKAFLPAKSKKALMDQNPKLGKLQKLLLVLWLPFHLSACLS